MGPVREITTTTFDEHSSRRYHVEASPSSSSAARSQTEMTNGTISEGFSFGSSLTRTVCSWNFDSAGINSVRQ